MSARRMRQIPGSMAGLGVVLMATLVLPTLACKPPEVREAEAFLEDAEDRLEKIWQSAERAAWVQANFITHDTELLNAEAQGKMLAATAELASQAARFNDMDLPEELSRKLQILKTSQPAAAPDDEKKTEELARILSKMEGHYGRGQYCPEGEDNECFDLEQLSRVMATSRDPDELLWAWHGWRIVSRDLRGNYADFVDLANEGARELGFADVGNMWQSGYDMSPGEFAFEIERLWHEVRPLYQALHCHVRARLSEFYGADVVAPDRGLPAHLLGNMWAQSWNNIYDLVAPEETDPGYDLTALLQARKMDARDMVRSGERFFNSLGFEPLPETFWQRSLFTKPTDREVVCHASAWNLDMWEDLRIKMCIEVTAEDFSTIHHELGHNFYQWAYRKQDPLFRDGAHDGFHEGIGDTVALSITPDYLVRIGLLDEAPSPDADLGLLMRMALDKVAFLPFGLVVDMWRWQVFAGVAKDWDYNRVWWELRNEYQGVWPPAPRTEESFDPGAKYHVPANTPYMRYFLASILQFQFHQALCEIAGYEGPLNRCSIYESDAAGERLREMLAMGRSRPWSEVLATLTGDGRMDATPILAYFAPLKKWLDEQNQDRQCGW